MEDHLSHSALASVRVLLVDDESDGIDLYAMVLEQHGARAVGAGSIRTALDLFDRLEPHVLVSDITLPDGDGYALLRAIRERGPDRGGKVLAIALTGWGHREDREKALAAGFDEHCSKPCTPGELTAVITRLLTRAKSTRA